MEKSDARLHITGEDLAEISSPLASKIGVCEKPQKPVYVDISDPLLKGRIEIHNPGPGVHLYILDLFSARDIESSVSMHTPTAVFSFILSGYCTQVTKRPNRHSTLVDFDAGKNVICTFQAECTKFNIAGGHTHRIVDLQIDPAKAHDLKHYFDSNAYGPIGSSFAKSEGSRWHAATVLTPHLEDIVRQILHCRFQGASRELFMKAKSLELLALELDSLESRRRRSQSKSGGFERERLELARHILQNEFSNPPSLIQLARRVGLNDFKLKRGFRDIYDTTVFGYIRQLRMQQAWHLLESEGFTVGETALAVGYQNFGHFSSAFKKHFGVLPSSVCSKSYTQLN